MFPVTGDSAVNQDRSHWLTTVLYYGAFRSLLSLFALNGR